jgi:hypothetical protein
MKNKQLIASLFDATTQSLMTHLPDDSDAITWLWEFDTNVTNLPSKFFQRLLSKHEQLNLKYRILCANITQNAKNRKKLESEQYVKKLTQQLIVAFMMTKLLSLLYERYLPNYQFLKRIKADRKLLRKTLGQLNYSSLSISLVALEPIDDKLIRLIGSADLPRVFASRSKGVLIDSIPLLAHWKSYSFALTWINEFAEPLIILLGWIFHGFRILLTLVHLAQHTIPGPWMSKYEKEISGYARFKMNFSMYWFQLTNDIIWIGTTLATSNMLVYALLTVLEAFVAIIQSLIEINRLQAVLNRLHLTASFSGSSLNENSEVESCKNFLELSISFEQKKMLLRIVTIISINGLIILKTILPLLIPSLALNPIIPFVLAALLLTITLVCYLIGKWLEKQKPVDKLEIKDSLLGVGRTPTYATGPTFFTKIKASGSCNNPVDFDEFSPERAPSRVN